MDIITSVIHLALIPQYIVDPIDQNNRSGKRIRKAEQGQEMNKALEKTNGKELEDTEVSITLKCTENDVQNIQKIQKHLDQLVDVFRENYDDSPDFFQQLKMNNVKIPDVGSEFTFNFKNNNLAFEDFQNNEEQITFFNYLNGYNLFLILAEHLESTFDLSAISLYISPHRTVSRNQGLLQVNLSEINYYALKVNYSRSSSRENRGSLIAIASAFFALRRRMAEREAKDRGYENIWGDLPEVKLADRYLAQLGYQWGIECVNEMKNIYQIKLKKDEKEFPIEQASSGELEILNIVMGILGMNISNGIILVEEPELHLHPKWQGFLIEMLIELAKDKSNQLIMTTHSPNIVSLNTIPYVSRIFKNSEGYSEVTNITQPIEIEEKRLIRIINVTNNSNIFFADKVVLVEGISDKIVFERLIELKQKAQSNSSVISVIEVGGKGNFDGYNRLLSRFDIPTYIITDFDFCLKKLNLDAEKYPLKANKLNKKIEDKKSTRRKRIIEILEEAIHKEKITDELKKLVDYLKELGVYIKSLNDLDEEDQKRAIHVISQFKQEHVFVLKYGEIEDYLIDKYRRPQESINEIKENVEKTEDIIVEKFVKEIEEILHYIIRN